MLASTVSKKSCCYDKDLFRQDATEGQGDRYIYLYIITNPRVDGVGNCNASAYHNFRK